jgi:hypothetical protein
MITPRAETETKIAPLPKTPGPAAAILRGNTEQKREETSKDGKTDDKTRGKSAGGTGSPPGDAPGLAHKRTSPRMNTKRSLGVKGMATIMRTHAGADRKHRLTIFSEDPLGKQAIGRMRRSRSKSNLSKSNGSNGKILRKSNSSKPKLRKVYREDDNVPESLQEPPPSPPRFSSGDEEDDEEDKRR